MQPCSKLLNVEKYFLILLPQHLSKNMPNHKYLTAILSVLLLFISITAGHAQEGKGENVKRGWSIVPLPALSYDSDMGVQLGVIVVAYYFGNGDTYPEYLHKFTAEACWFTKGSGIYHFFYDSKHLIKGHRLTASASYIPNTMRPFFGFNGYLSPYNSGMSSAFYAMKRNLERIIGDVQGTVAGDLGWSAGISFYHIATGRVQADEYSQTTTLYDLYADSGLIKEKEKHGGSHLELRLGAVYDTRDHEPDPSRGIYSDIIVYGSPDIFNGREENYLRLAASFRHFIPVIPKRLTFAYRLSYQGTLAGNLPFYMQNNFTTLFLRQINSDVLGGAISLRGVQYNRILADGAAWANFELRIRLFRFRLLGQDWYTAANPFFDIGQGVQPYRLDAMKNVSQDRDKIYSGDNEAPHMSAGLGLKLVMNENFVLSAELGKPFDRRDGKYGIYLNLNYIF